MSKFHILVLVLLGVVSSVEANTRLNDRTSIVFATVEQAKTILGRKDEFIERMSPFDRAARMKTDKVASEKEFLSFVVRNILPWDKKETANVEAALAAVKRGLTKFSVNFPATIFVVKTTGKEEGQAAYTRANAIILPKHMLSGQASKLQKTIAHELFHILSRSNPKLRASLYAVIGFKACNEIDFPSGLKSRKLTNPDAPRNDHYIEVSLKGKPVSVVPVLFSRSEKYDVQSGREFFSYLEFRLLAVKKDATGKKFVAIYKDKKPMLFHMRDVGEAYLKQIGRNTGYIIHPEEILAENFALLVAGKQNVPSPEILKKMLSVLSKKKTATK
ncbi:MAG: hypothetical protein ISS69_05980 [Phycisphaerae bacterium]|nr:hypothetical protein [Phycisphaerae bacterium]